MTTTTDPRSALRAFRRCSGFSQAQLARRAGLSRETVGRLEQGDTPQLRTARALATVLGAPVEVLFPIDEDPADEPGLVTASAEQGRHDGE